MSETASKGIATQLTRDLRNEMTVILLYMTLKRQESLVVLTRGMTEAQGFTVWARAAAKDRHSAMVSEPALGRMAQWSHEEACQK